MSSARVRSRGIRTAQPTLCHWNPVQRDWNVSKKALWSAVECDCPRQDDSERTHFLSRKLQRLTGNDSATPKHIPFIHHRVEEVLLVGQGCIRDGSVGARRKAACRVAKTAFIYYRI